jgi:RNase adaptor protein for sRNA GlmZ degradation
LLQRARWAASGHLQRSCSIGVDVSFPSDTFGAQVFGAGDLAPIAVLLKKGNSSTSELLFLSANIQFEAGLMGFVILTGASGSGKTAISEAIASRNTESVEVYHFDQVGVPSPEEMIANYGSTEAWQLAKTYEWMAKIAATRETERHVLFEGQMRCSFALEAAAAAGITEFILILVDCDDTTRIRRLTSERRQPDLANPTMMSWARYLRNEAHQLHCTILDTTLLSLEECVKQIWTHFWR